MGVVGDAHRQPEGGGQLRAEGDVVEAEVGGPHDHSLGVDDAWSGDADPEQWSIGLPGELTSEIDGSRSRCAGP